MSPMREHQGGYGSGGAARVTRSGCRLRARLQRAGCSSVRDAGVGTRPLREPASATLPPMQTRYTRHRKRPDTGAARDRSRRTAQTVRRPDGGRGFHQRTAFETGRAAGPSRDRQRRPRAQAAARPAILVAVPIATAAIDRSRPRAISLTVCGMPKRCSIRSLIYPARPLAMSNPKPSPRSEAMKPVPQLSPMNSARIWPRVAPSARRMPISVRRCVTATAKVL